MNMKFIQIGVTEDGTFFIAWHWNDTGYILHPGTLNLIVV